MHKVKIFLTDGISYEINMVNREEVEELVNAVRAPFGRWWIKSAVIFWLKTHRLYIHASFGNDKLIQFRQKDVILIHVEWDGEKNDTP